MASYLRSPDPQRLALKGLRPPSNTQSLQIMFLYGDYILIEDK